MSTVMPPRRSGVSASLARSKLGTSRVASFSLSAVAPLTVSGGVVPVAFAVTGLVGLAVVFPVAGAVLAVWAVGYTAMVRLVPNAGAIYALVAHGLSRRIGVGAAFVAWGTYSCFAFALLGSIGASAGALARDWAGVSAPWWVWALGASVLASALGLAQVSIASRILGYLLLGEILIAVVYAVAFLLHPADGGTVTFSALSPVHLADPGMGAAWALAITSFAGVEGGAVFSEESRSQRTVGRAIYISLAVATTIYTLMAWALPVTVGADKIVALSAAGGTETIFTLAATYLPKPLIDLGLLFFVTSMFAALVSFRSMCDRYGFSLGREGVLPAAFGRTSPRTSAPVTASHVMTVLSLAVIAVYAITDADPVVQLFYVWAGLGGFGVLVLLLLTSVAVVFYFARHPAEAATVTRWQRQIAPALATAALTVMLLLVLANFDVLLGVDPSSPLRWALPAAFTVLAAVGLVWAQTLRSTRPHTYAAIGLGPDAITDRTTNPPRETV
ncbi:APC family permease [Cryptosporangium sp. NPDC048952]|uniref:APC family permease n=1 Tax=Cryptosporangium sp. NPDC048952 TaxID=3363961 RepID=UPI00371538ED